MKRRQFISSAIAAGLTGSTARSVIGRPNAQLPSQTLPSKTLKDRLNTLRADCHTQLFDQYLPFWEQGGFDQQNGGFMCYLHDDGSVQNDQKDIWFQGRGIWVYSTIYNQIDRNPKWLEIASNPLYGRQPLRIHRLSSNLGTLESSPLPAHARPPTRLHHFCSTQRDEG